MLTRDRRSTRGWGESGAFWRRAAGRDAAGRDRDTPCGGLCSVACDGVTGDTLHPEVPLATAIG